MAKAPESGRFYQRDGTFVPGADARTAKRDGLLPSVTTLLRELATPHGLVQWRERQVALRAGMTAVVQAATGRTPERDHQWADTEREAAWADSRRKRDAGTDLHGVIAAYLAGRWGVTCDDLPGELLDTLDGLGIMPGGTSRSERLYISEQWGFAGTIDYIGYIEGTLGVADWKTKSVPPEYATPRWEREWRSQLAGYCVASGTPLDRCYNVVICRDTGRVWSKRYDLEPMLYARRRILQASVLWYTNREVPDADLPPLVRVVLEAMG